MLTLGASFRFLLDGSMDRLGEEARRDEGDEGDEERAGRGPGDCRRGLGCWIAELLDCWIECRHDTTASRVAAAAAAEKQQMAIGGRGRWERGSESKTTAGWEKAEMR